MQTPLKKHRLEYIDVSDLLFDPENPRLPERATYSQNQIFDTLERYFDILPIARSMAENGYFDEEPLMVIGKKKEPHHYVVVEGNRRLAALKLLTDPNFRKRSPNRHIYDELAASLVEPLNLVPVVKSRNREELIPKLGFRHIAGIMKWESLSKARYIHSLVEKTGTVDLKAVGRDLGFEEANVKKNYLAYRIFLQAREQGIETRKIEEDFGFWYTALGYGNIQKFIGYDPKDKKLHRLKNPVPESKLDQLSELVGWIFGTPSVPKAILESRELGKLAKVLSSPNALKHLRDGGSFPDAYSLVEGEPEALVKIFDRATLSLETSLRLAYKQQEMDPTVLKAFKNFTRAFLEVLKYFPETKKTLTEHLASEKAC